MGDKPVKTLDRPTILGHSVWGYFPDGDVKKVSRVVGYHHRVGGGEESHILETMNTMYTLSFPDLVGKMAFLGSIHELLDRNIDRV